MVVCVPEWVRMVLSTELGEFWLPSAGLKLRAKVVVVFFRSSDLTDIDLWIKE